jgi:N6-L-threonylcarbamoyladenine synthase
MGALAEEYREKISGVAVSVKGMECNLSGLENKAAEAYEKTNDKSYVSAYVFEFVGKTLYRMSEAFKEEYGDIPIIYAGGVMSNRYINKTLTERFGGLFAESQYSCDNAAGIARLTEMKLLGEL